MRTVGFLTINFTVITLFLALPALAGGPDQIHFGSTDTPLKGLTITYRSTTPSGSIKWGYTGNLEKGTHTASRSRGIEGSNYSYTFPDLLASSTLYYSLKDGSGWTPVDSFKTARDPAVEGFTFIAGGDSRGYPGPTDPPWGWKSVAPALAKEDVDFTIYLADIVFKGGRADNWLWWYDFGKDFIKKSLIYHSFAGHDGWCESGEFCGNFDNELTLPGNKRYYSFVYGNARFICLRSEYSDDIDQYNWLISTLTATQEEWIVVYFHRPFFCWPKHPEDMTPYRNTWWKAFDDFGVDVVLGGHCHNYIRSKPINLNVSSTKAVAEYGDQPGQGRLEIVSGGFGAPLSGLAEGWFVEETANSFHYCKFSVNGGILHMDVYDTDENLIDSLTLKKSATTAKAQFTSASTAQAEVNLPFGYRFGYTRPVGQNVSVAVDSQALPEWLAVKGDSLFGTPKAPGNASVVAWLKNGAGVPQDTLELRLTITGTHLVQGQAVEAHRSLQLRSAAFQQGRLNFQVHVNGGEAFSLRVANGLGQTLWSHAFAPAGKKGRFVLRNLQTGKTLRSGVYTVILRQENKEASRRLVVAR